MEVVDAYVGLDVHKDTITVAIAEAAGPDRRSSAVELRHQGVIATALTAKRWRGWPNIRR